MTDVEAPLPDATIAARKLGILAVAGFCNATIYLHTSDRIEQLNGSTGSIKIPESA